jgi:hypothetical protein
MLASRMAAFLFAACVLAGCRPAAAAAVPADGGLSDSRRQDSHRLERAIPSGYDWLGKRATVSPALIQAALSCENVCSKGIQSALVVESGPWLRTGGGFTQQHRRVMTPDPQLVPRSAGARTARPLADPDEVLAALRGEREVVLQLASVERISPTKAKVTVAPTVLHTQKDGIGIGCSDFHVIRRKGGAWCCDKVSDGCWTDASAVQPIGV